MLLYMHTIWNSCDALVSDEPNAFDDVPSPGESEPDDEQSDAVLRTLLDPPNLQTESTDLQCVYDNSNNNEAAPSDFCV